LKLLEYRAEQQVAQMPRARATPKPPTKYKVKKGDTLKSIAARLLGASNKWQVIEKANKGLRGWKIPAKFVGKTIKVPPRT
jgi:nucleoid-associated protein YgaU